ncbi:C39 family peptidase [Deinococcus multiflagellatus]|uniref:C39 family peptidase n=1 Tax=Deinococcus multiflagellatus TaxID=1656887 RepID=A0ABW1ZU08_9DEIO|nr:C39 family peptidase [Deinococcus multiflagellatus]MBZ9714419.1 C39 family peptidase [Deinococcus multiflagellatus]
MRRLLALLLLGPGAHAASPPPRVTATDLAMPLVRQTYNACGPASLEMLLGYWGLKVPQAVISPQVRPSPTAYTPVNTIAPFAAQYGLQTLLVSHATVNTVRSLLARKVPSLLLTDLKTPGKVPHWRVASGFNDARRAVNFHDPLLGHVAIGYDDLQQLWANHQGLLVVLYPPAWAAYVKAGLL